MICVGKPAPGFSCQAVHNNAIKQLSLSEFDNQYKVLFFYPLDFTFVCPTELHAFQEKLHEFEKRNCAVLAASIDSAYSHSAWLKTPKAQGGIQGITYPIIADINKSIARDYGVLDEQQGVALRGVFLLDKDNIVQSAQVNNLSLGRSVDEILRLLDALQHAEAHGEVCPANWNAGDRAMKPNDSGLKEYFGQ